jgi:hypothetical protein
MKLPIHLERGGLDCVTMGGHLRRTQATQSLLLFLNLLLPWVFQLSVMQPSISPWFRAQASHIPTASLPPPLPPTASASHSLTSRAYLEALCVPQSEASPGYTNIICPVIDQKAFYLICLLVHSGLFSVPSFHRPGNTCESQWQMLS